MFIGKLKLDPDMYFMAAVKINQRWSPFKCPIMECMFFSYSFMGHEMFGKGPPP